MKMSTIVVFLCGCGFALAFVLLTIAATASPTRRLRPLEAGERLTWLQRLQSVRSSRSIPAAVAAAGLVWWATDWPVAGLAAAAGILGLPPVLAPARPRRALSMAEALTAWCRRLADLLTSGSGGLEHALMRSAATTPEPLTAPVEHLAEQMRSHGAEPALRSFAAELQDPAVDEIVLALLLRLQHGGRGLADTLHAHAEALSAEASSRREIEADRATSRTTVRSLVGITLALFAGLILFARDYLAPIDSPLGQGVLALAVVIAAAALWWMYRLATTTPATRYLGAATTQSTQDEFVGGAL